MTPEEKILEEIEVFNKLPTIEVHTRMGILSATPALDDGPPGIWVSFGDDTLVLVTVDTMTNEVITSAWDFDCNDNAIVEHRHKLCKCCHEEVTKNG